MPDMEGFREANNFGLGQAQATDNFHVKGASNLPWGMKDRLTRIFNPKSGKAVLLAFDHGFIMGPTSGLERIDLSIVPLLEYADCLMCTRGILQSSIPAATNKPVCLRSDAGSSILTELNRNVLIDLVVPEADAATRAEGQSLNFSTFVLPSSTTAGYQMRVEVPKLGQTYIIDIPAETEADEFESATEYLFDIEITPQGMDVNVQASPITNWGDNGTINGETETVE